VEGVLACPEHFKIIKEHILERSHLLATSAVRVLFGQDLFKLINEHIQERSRLPATSVERVLACPAHFKIIK